LVQAVLGAVSVYLVYRLACLVLSRARTDASDRPGAAWTRSVPLVAAAIAAANPYYVLMSSLILSEAVFVPLSLATLCGLAALWDAPGQPVTGRSALRRDLIALLSGIAAGAAILVRPSWLLFLPAVIAIWLFIAARDRTSFFPAARAAGVFALAVAIVMGPWWVRNARVYGRFVPTALWAGASLYDGLNESATGASDMSFLFDPAFWPLDEEDQDAELTRRAVAFVREQPVRALELAWVKLLRFWSPWPNAGVFQIPALALASTLVTVPLFALLAIGIWDHRLDPKAWVLLLGPLLYFCALHLAFASSVRYRIPAEMPALGLAALGWLKIQAKFISASRPPLATG
jgi:4-amino-4-deoxy-L-arabinose transferase-like glycosyltransferase